MKIPANHAIHHQTSSARIYLRHPHLDTHPPPHHIPFGLRASSNATQPRPLDIGTGALFRLEPARTWIYVTLHGGCFTRSSHLRRPSKHVVTSLGPFLGDPHHLVAGMAKLCLQYRSLLAGASYKVHTLRVPLQRPVLTPPLRLSQFRHKGTS